MLGSDAPGLSATTITGRWSVGILDSDTSGLAHNSGQLCWLHKTANVLDKLPKGTQPKAKAALHEIYEAETKADAEKGFDLFVKTYEAEIPRRSNAW